MSGRHERKDAVIITLLNERSGAKRSIVYANTYIPEQDGELYRAELEKCPRLTQGHINKLCSETSSDIAYITTHSTSLDSFGTYISSYTAFKKYQKIGAKLQKVFDSKKVNG